MQRRRDENSNLLFRYWDYIFVTMLSTILAASIGLGESDTKVSIRELEVIGVMVGVMALILWIYSCSQKLEDDKQRTMHRVKLLGVSALFIVGSGLLLTFYAPSVLDQSHSRLASEWLCNTFHTNPLTFQVRSYEFGYQLLAGLIAWIIGAAFYRKIYMKDTENKSIANNAKKIINTITLGNFYKDAAAQKNQHLTKHDVCRATLCGFLFTSIVYGANFIIHSRAAAWAHSTRPITGTKWADSILTGSLWANVDGLWQVSTASGNSNWYSGHVSWVATMFWLAVFYLIYSYHQEKKSPAQPKGKKNTATTTPWTFIKQNPAKVIMTFILGAMVLATAVCRVGGMAHTLGAVISGAVIAAFTVAIGIGLFEGIHRWLCSSVFSPCSKSE